MNNEEDSSDIEDMFEDDRIDNQPELSYDQKETERLIKEILDTVGNLIGRPNVKGLKKGITATGKTIAGLSVKNFMIAVGTVALVTGITVAVAITPHNSEVKEETEKQEVATIVAETEPITETEQVTEAEQVVEPEPC